jgi:hypothetical protein
MNLSTTEDTGDAEVKSVQDSSSVSSVSFVVESCHATSSTSPS